MASGRLHHETNVVVQVRILSRGIDPVDVEIDGHGPDLQTLDTGFLGGFSEGDTGKVGIAVGVSAGLDPDLQLGVEQHECAFEVGVDHERGAGEMAGTFVTLERVGTSIE